MSTEIGHHLRTVYRSQDGKLIVPSSAYIDVESDGEIQIESGGLLQAKAGSTILNLGSLRTGNGGLLRISSGGRMVFESSSYYTDEAIFRTTTTGGRLKPYGLNIIATTQGTADGGTHHIGQPKKGAHMRIVVDTSAKIEIRSYGTSTSALVYPVRLGTSITTIAFTSDHGKAVKATGRPTVFHLHAGSSNRWYITSVAGSSIVTVTPVAAFTFSSCTG